MFRKISNILMASVLILSLAACGMGNDEVAYDPSNDGFPNNPLRVREDADRGTSGEMGVQRNLNRENNNRTSGNNVDTNISASLTTINSEKYPHTKAVLIQDAKYSFTQIDEKEIQAIQKKIEQKLKARYGQLTPQLQQQAKQQAAQQVQQQSAQQPKHQTKEPAQRQPKQQTQQPAQEQPKQQTQQPAQEQPKQQTQQPAQEQPKQQTQQPAQEQPKQQTQQPAQEQPKQQTQQPANAQGNMSQYAQEVINLTNQERAREGLPALKADAELSSVALKKSQDMQANNYFSHTSPTYGSPFDMMRDFGVTYKTAGENIAQGQRTPQEVVQAWMNSEGHRKNIMSKDFTHIGVGHEPSGNHWTQMFVGR